MHTLTVRRPDGHFDCDLGHEQIGALLKEPGTLIWLDIANPDQGDIALLRDDFKFHPLAIEDAIQDTQRPKIDAYPGYYLVVFYAAHFDEAAKRIETQELDLFVGRNFIVSVHDGRLTQVHETLQRWQSPTSPFGTTVTALLYALLDAIVDDYFPLVDQIAERVDDLEDEIFSHFDDAAIETIFGLKKDLLLLRRTLAPERDVINVLMRREVTVFDANDVIYLQDLYDHIIRVTDAIDTYRDLLSSALDSFLSLQSNKLNQIVKVLTVTSIVLMTCSLIAGIYGMNFDVMPELHWRFGYLFALGLMVALSAGLVLLFRRLRWL